MRQQAYPGLAADQRDSKREDFGRLDDESKGAQNKAVTDNHREAGRHPGEGKEFAFTEGLLFAECTLH